MLSTVVSCLIKQRKYNDNNKPLVLIPPMIQTNITRRANNFAELFAEMLSTLARSSDAIKLDSLWRNPIGGIQNY